MALESTQLDPAALSRLNELLGAQSASVLPRLIARFDEQGPQLVADMVAAAANGDAEAIRRAAHTLKSNAAYFGAEKLRLIVYEIEIKAKADDLVGVDDLLAAATTALDGARTALQKLAAETSG